MKSISINKDQEIINRFLDFLIDLKEASNCDSLNLVEDIYPRLEFFLIFDSNKKENIKNFNFELINLYNLLYKNEKIIDYQDIYPSHKKNIDKSNFEKIKQLVLQNKIFLIEQEGIFINDFCLSAIRLIETKIQDNFHHAFDFEIDKKTRQKQNELVSLIEKRMIERNLINNKNEKLDKI